MPAYSRVDDALAAKIVSFYPENTKHPTHMAWVLYFEPSTGDLKAVSSLDIYSGHTNMQHCTDDCSMHKPHYTPHTDI